jgi:hypothetical protein
VVARTAGGKWQLTAATQHQQSAAPADDGGVGEASAEPAAPAGSFQG